MTTKAKGERIRKEFGVGGEVNNHIIKALWILTSDRKAVNLEKLQKIALCMTLVTIKLLLSKGGHFFFFFFSRYPYKYPLQVSHGTYALIKFTIASNLSHFNFLEKYFEPLNIIINQGNLSCI